LVWIPNCVSIAKSLYETTKGTVIEPLEWTGETDDAYTILIKAPYWGPVLAIPSLAQFFVQYVSERKEIAMGVLTPKLWIEPHPVAYVLKKLDGTALGWPGCLTEIAVTALVVEEATKISLGQLLEVLIPIKSVSLLN
jgi:hypothetical protein